MPSGLLAVHLCYPDMLHLPLPSAYTLTVQNRRAAIHILHGHRTLHLIDLANPLVPSKGDAGVLVLPHDIPAKYSNDSGIVVTFEQDDDVINIHKVTFDTRSDGLYRTFQTRYATELVVVYEITNIDSVTQLDREFYSFVVDEFVHIYRITTNDFRPRLLDDCREPIRLDYINIPYDESDQDKSINEKLEREREIKNYSAVAWKTLADGQPFVQCPIKEAGQKIATFADENRQITSAEEFLSSAMHAESQSKDSTYAVLEAFISAELFVVDYLRQEKLRRGVSGAKIKTFGSEVGIGYMLNIELPMLIENIDQQGREILGDVDRVRRMRNDIVHEGKRATAADAKFAVRAATRLHEMMRGGQL